MRSLTKVLLLEKIPSGTAQQRKIAIQGGRVRSYPSKSLEETRRVYDIALKGVGRPSEPFSGAVRLSLAFYYGTKDRAKQKALYKETRPDLDNLVKPFQDALVRNGFLKEDSNVVFLCARKCWSDTTRIFFQLEEVE